MRFGSCPFSETLKARKKMEYFTSVQRIGRREEAAKFLGRLVSKKFNIDRSTLDPVFAGLTTEKVEELGEFFLEARTLEEIHERAEKMRQRKS